MKSTSSTKSTLRSTCFFPGASRCCSTRALCFSRCLPSGPWSWRLRTKKPSSPRLSCPTRRRHRWSSRCRFVKSPRPSPNKPRRPRQPPRRPKPSISRRNWSASPGL
ncbi:unnamed protein product, partial [Ectocarpus fasciculatus]